MASKKYPSGLLGAEFLTSLNTARAESNFTLYIKFIP